MKITYRRPRHFHKIVIALLITAMTTPSWLLTRSATANSPKDLEIIASFASLERTIRSLPTTLLTARQRASLEAALEEAQSAFTKGDSCAGAKTLFAALSETQTLHKDSHNALVEDLHNHMWTLRQDILFNLPKGTKCEDSPRASQAPKVDIIESTAERLRGRVTFGDVTMTSISVDKELFTELHIPGLETNGGKAGFPGVPFVHKLVAVPEGAKPVLVVKADDQAQTLKVNLYPIQPQPMDRADDPKVEKEDLRDRFKEPPFTKDNEVYARNEAYPDHIGTVTNLGRARDLRMARLSIAAGQYNPVTKSLTLFSSVDFEMSFPGGKGAFLDKMSMSPFETLTANNVSTVLNSDVVFTRANDIDVPRRLLCGEEFLILTHPDFRKAADTLAEWKNTKGIPTSVAEVNDGDGSGPDNAFEIDTFIDNRFNRCGLRPSYVLLLGDAEFIPTWYTQTSGSATTGTDYPYAFLTGVGDVMPDFAVGRIPVDTLNQANTVVDKIVRYESNPPNVASFYQNVGIASQFQCCRPTGTEGRDQRSFIETSEFARNVVLSQGYDADRIYTQSVESNYDGDPIPRRYYNGTLLPQELRVANGFVWDADTDDIVKAWNAGRFLFFHRDHGGKDGWVHPEFTSTNVTDDLTNGELLPVVFSVNCASGLFDNETANQDYNTTVDGVYFSERLLRKADGGAVGILGDTRDSPTWANSALSRGFFDAVWPETLGDFGNQKSLRRLGDILNHGKLYLATQVGEEGTTEAPTAGNLVSELFLWHVIGDPTLEMWTRRPLNQMTLDYTAVVDINRIRIKYDFNWAKITAYQESKSGIIALGRSEVLDGEATIEFVRRPVAGLPIQLSVSFPDMVSVKLAPIGK